jgi:hypothetical protein
VEAKPKRWCGRVERITTSLSTLSNGNSHYYLGNEGFKTRDDAVDALVKEFA